MKLIMKASKYSTVSFYLDSIWSNFMNSDLKHKSSMIGISIMKNRLQLLQLSYFIYPLTSDRYTDIFKINLSKMTWVYTDA